MNNKKLFLLLIPLLLVSIVSAASIDLSDYPDMFAATDKFYGILSVADNAPAEDVIGISDIAMSIQYRGEETGTTISKVEVGATKLASEVSDPNAQNLLLVGMLKRDASYGNPLIDKFYSGSPTEGLIKLIKNGNYYVLIVTGDTTTNVRKATTILANYKDYNLKGTELRVSDAEKFQVGPVEIIPYDIKDTLSEGETKLYTLNGVDYEITARYVKNPYASLRVNGVVTNSLEIKGIDKMSDGSRIQVIDIITADAGDIVDNLVEFVFKGKETKNCEDSDGGKDYYTQGKILTSGLIGSGEGSDGEDYCLDDDSKLSNQGTYLVEWYCCEGYCADNENYKCPNGCKDGACIDEETEPEEEEEESKDHLIVVDDKGPVTDVIAISDLGVYLKSEGYTVAQAKLNSEVTKNMLDYRVTTFIYEGEAAIIVGAHSSSKDVALTYKISDFLENKKGIKSITKLSSEIKYDDLRKILTDDLPEDTEEKEEIPIPIIPEEKDECSSNLDCNDNNSCTSDVCSGKPKKCSNTESSIGCDYNEKCIPVSVRVDNSYCDIDKKIKTQKTEDNSCNNSYECSTNICVDDKCISPGLIRKILDWFKKIF